MASPFKVGLVYINTNNIGDIVIFDTTKYLIKSSLESQGVRNYKIVPIDMGEKVAGKVNMPASFAKKQQQKYATANKHVKEWKSSKLHYYFATTEIPKVKEMDVIVFAGGGLIKFHEQLFHMYIDEVTGIADEYHIPVIFNAVGVEGYKQDDPRCRILKHALNRSCVKAISTRDNLALLQEEYLSSKKAHLVCDPALWAMETYGIAAKESGVVGLGVIRPEIFSLYGAEAPRNEILKFYAMIITGLEKNGIEYKLFTNGGRRDYQFIEDIRIFMKRGDEFKDRVGAIPKSGKALTKMISRYSRVLTCRMHAAVIAYALHIPSVSVVWNKKQQYFAELTKQPKNLIAIGDFNNSALVMKKILRSAAPDIDESYKNTGYDFIYRNIKKSYQRRHLLNGRRLVSAMKYKLSTKLPQNR